MPLSWKSRPTLQEFPLLEKSHQDDNDKEVESGGGESSHHRRGSLNASSSSSQSLVPTDTTESGCHHSTKQCSLYLGFTYSCLSSFFFSACSVIVKYLDYIHPGELATFRFLGIIVFTIPLVIYYRQPPFGPGELRHFLILRGLVGATSLFLRFCALRYLPIADASVIIFSVPVFVSVFARLCLKEPCGLFHFIALGLTLLGLALITKLPLIIGSPSSVATSGSESTEHWLGIGAALTSTVFGASVYIVIRKIRAVHHAVIMFNFGWVAIIETTVLTAILRGFSLPRCGLDPWLIVLLGIFSFLGQVLLTRALQLEQAGPVSVVRAAADIAFAFAWQVAFFGEVPDAYSISGAVLVTSCVVLTSIRKWVMSLPEHSVMHRRLICLTW